MNKVGKPRRYSHQTVKQKLKTDRAAVRRRKSNLLKTAAHSHSYKGFKGEACAMERAFSVKLPKSRSTYTRYRRRN
jgi:hypothetical protein